MTGLQHYKNIYSKFRGRFFFHSINIMHRFRSLSFLEEINAAAQDHLKRLLEIENLCISLNDHYLLQTQKIFGDSLKSKFSGTKPILGSENMKNALSYLAAAGFANLDSLKVAERLVDLKDEGFKEPIEVFSKVKSYWKIAYKRHVDNVAAGIISVFVGKFSSDLGERLLMQLGNDEDNLIKEDPKVVSKRQELLNRKARLAKVKQDLIQSGLI